MRKAEIAEIVAEQTGISKTDIILVIETYLRVIRRTLRQKESVYIRGFGTFMIKKRAAKKGQNIRKKETIDIPAHYVPHFKAASALVKSIKNIPIYEDKKK